MGEIGPPMETLRFGLNVQFVIRQQLTAVALPPLSFHQPANRAEPQFSSFLERVTRWLVRRRSPRLPGGQSGGAINVQKAKVDVAILEQGRKHG
jgi:hypothetical protein